MKKGYFKSKTAEMVEMRNNGMGLDDIARHFGCSNSIVSTYTGKGYKHGGTVNKEKSIKECSRLISEGYNRKQIAEILGLSYQHVIRLCVKMRKNRVNTESINDVLKLRRDGLCVRDVAKKLGISENTVVAYSKGHKFKPHRDKAVKKAPKIDKVSHRDVLQNGIAKNKDKEVLPTRIELGRPLEVLYSDISKVPTQKATIYTKHKGSDYEAVMIWAKKYNKKSFALSKYSFIFEVWK